MNRKNEFIEGLRDGIPICLGYLAVSFALGIQAAAIGMTAFQAVAMSLLNVTSAGEFSALNLIATQAPFIEMALLQLIVNMRYLLMSTALTQKIRPDLPLPHRLGIAYGVTDEIFALSVLRKGVLNPLYSYGLIVVSVFGWCLGTLLGSVAGQIMPQPIISALGLAIYGMFLAIIVPETREKRPILVVVLTAMALSALFTWVPVIKELSSGFRIILITVAVAAGAAVLAPVTEEEDGDAEKGEQA